MSNWILRFALAVLPLVLAVQSFAADFVPYKVGSVVRTAIDVGNRMQLALPEGEWLIIASQITTNGSHSRFYNVALIDSLDGVPHRLIRSSSSLDSVAGPGFNGGYVFFKECSRTDVHYVKVFMNIEGNKQDCWLVNHLTMTLGNHPSADYVEAMSYFTTRGLPMPINTVASLFHFANRSNQYMDVTVMFNPEADGFPPPTSGDWRASEWHKDRAYQDPAKKAYIEKVVAWGSDAHDQFKAGYEGKLAVGVSAR